MENEINTIINSLDLTTINETMKKILQMQAIVKNTLKSEHDYGVIPGTNKPTLLKPGGEKICMLFGLSPEYEILKSTEDFSQNFFNYDLKCTLMKNHNSVAQGVGNCNSKEKRYRYSMVEKIPEDYTGRSEKIEDKYGRVRYKIENQDLCNFINTILKMAKKRAFIDAVLQVASLSDIFTQDLEDISEFLQNDSSSTGKVKLTFGKYKGETLEDIFSKDNKYFMWLHENENTESMIKRACEEIINENCKNMAN